MKAVKRWRYYCDFCKKAGQSGHHMQNHERSCTLNPERVCKLCGIINGSNGTPLPEMLALLPDPAKFIRTIPAENLGWDLGEIPAREELDDAALREAVHAVLQGLRELTDDCPVCILAALRQKHIPVPVVEDFNFTTEMKAAQVRMNEARAEQAPHCGGGY